jgi:alkanesulfonate monooxygenase SsuD/methylene tetrahydromethanopterin reductase-like flavin-dependent oxidoreductase (luciferase family)
LLGKMAATLQAFSGGRFVLGYGAGWMEHEYHAYGYEFPSAKVRIEQMVEGIEVMKALWTGGPVSYEGKYYRLRDAVCEPRPEPTIPILIGGDGERFLLRAVAQHADWWLPFGRTPGVLRQKIAVLKDHCVAVGRDYDSIRKTFTLRVHLAKTRAEAERLVGGAPMRPDDPAYVGDPAGLRERIAEYAELGIDLFQLVFPQFPATDDMELFVQEVLPAFQ